MNRIFTTRMWQGMWADRSEGRFFTMWFSRDIETKSQLVIGGADTDKFEGELINVPVPQGLPYVRSCQPLVRCDVLIGNS